MNITVFGGAKLLPNDPDYAAALWLGKSLALDSHCVLTGGYVGSMEAISRGAAESGGHVIGVTCEEIERWRKGIANPWVKEEWKMPTLDSRIIKLIDSCDAAIALPGGPGTLAEIAMMWNRMLVEATPSRPLILVGEGWQKVFSGMFSSLDPYVPLKDRRLISFDVDVNSAFERIRTIFSLYPPKP